MHQLADCTHHARVRMQQRGIDEAKLDLLMAYGRAVHNHHGQVLVHMDRRAIRSALKERGREAGPMLEPVRGIFAVVGSNGVVVTVAHRYRRVRR
jgi:hypothetical protein